MIALIDGDILVYRCGFAVEKSKYKVFIRGEEHYGPVAVYKYKKDIPSYYLEDTDCYLEKETEVEPLSNALHGVKETIQSILSATNAIDYRLYLSGENNFREKIAVTKPYKGNRDKLHKPKWYNEIRDYLIREWKAIVVDGIEADDAIGIGQYTHIACAKDTDYETIICSIDKDLDMIPGWHYNFVERKKYWIDEKTAIRKFYLQLLTGDITDNIQGCLGVGIKTAEKILSGKQTEEEMREAVRQKYSDVYGADKCDIIMKEMSDLLWIKRYE